MGSYDANHSLSLQTNLNLVTYNPLTDSAVSTGSEPISELEKYASERGLPTVVREQGEPLFLEGGSADGLYYIVENDVKMLKNDLRGKTMFLWFARPCELIGLTSFFHRNTGYTCSAIVGDKPCSYIYFPADEFTQMLEMYPKLKLRLLKMLCNRISFMEMRTKNMLYHSIDERLVETLLFLALKEGEETENDHHNGLPIRYTKTELAQMVGASTEYLRRRMKQLKSKRVIDYGRSWLSVNDLNKLRLMTITTHSKYK